MKKTIVVSALLVMAGSTQAAVFYTGQDGAFIPTDTAIFDDTVLGGGGTTGTMPGIDTHGMNFRSIYVDNPSGFWGYAFPGGDGTASCYFNGGANDIMAFSRLDNGDFDTVEFQVGAGWSGPDGFYWFTVFNNGVQVDSFDLDAPYGTWVGITGGGFDEVRVGAYVDAASRDAHDDQGYNAVAIDNVGYGIIPAPTSAGLLALGGLFAARRRR